MKSPILVAIINYWIWGLGSLLSGGRRLSNSLIALGCLPLTYLSLSFSPIGPFTYAEPSTWPLQFLGMMAVSIGFAISGFVEAREAGKL